ncbi:MULTISPECIES: hypothetical protein [Hydrogenophaga]|uniref:hypothetical protein n=1 Tax=Hydrogenophaga TaxID=47420 RepID=UPI00110E4D67|nr:MULTISPECIES: hypothetical protein [Hydrogenophaga]TMU75213.1 hypothetical protein FGJ01_11740 [Hydrogenophaga intermedia]
MTDGQLGFFGALIGALIAVVGAAWSQHLLDQRRKRTNTRFEIYQRLLALNERYFWVARVETSSSFLADRSFIGGPCLRLSLEGIVVVAGANSRTPVTAIAIVQAVVAV